MEAKKLQEIIAEENEDREREVLCEARNLINEIAKEQARKRAADERIAQLREELKALNVETLDESEVLG